MEVSTQLIATPFPITLAIRREDLIHPVVSGNKYRKLKYNLKDAISVCARLLVTFGGPHSNHIAATAFAAHEAGLSSLGLIRGEEWEAKLSESPTLQFARECGMEFRFLSRENYRMRNDPAFSDSLRQQWPHALVLPEGGTNELAVTGCSEILGTQDENYDIICCPVGTGGTIAGLSRAAAPHQKILGFPALKGDFLKEDIRKFANNDNWELVTGYEFGGYAQTDDRLVAFINAFYAETGIPLDPVYTGKMVFGVMKEIATGRFAAGTRILLIHTGGLQGVTAMNARLQKMKRPILTLDV
ncbi:MULTISPECIES: 1-aminocyclopropane-1-carboxylate deaminase/D-cysteine desulfhydrase [unclassified Flavobacterium]|uniref:1-aminocyclopropane-1-carboxylate deaminase/D-cysteine desulfhydrase n=1 Tax=unclassified Flavobacterium TaxID=196869 RepID=UPI001F1435A8|nr:MULTISPECIES: pyridoxal-phosphate dependent enzyme [unclassified Flavobacterium]UMY66947.1 pyridoxal-phosphate dependent enzyme [Flavobacterium sp. HJ-32-4]